MKRLSLQHARKEFLNFFASKEHLVLKSFSLIPENDKSLLLINAGMAPLKQYFTKEKKFSKDRVSTSQKCIRTADIENIGKTERHATFFEMLGNFSFGDYFKKEAIHWAWEFLHRRMEIEKERFWITVFKEDDEAFRIWNEEIGIEQDRILRLGKEDNFWELEVGPCGPCSEIHIDRGEKYAKCAEDVSPLHPDSSRFTEVWNLVFTQFNRTENGEYLPLASPNIDTGMGLERLAMISQDADNIFEIDFMKKLMGEVEKLSHKKYKTLEKDDISMRIIGDHTKAMTFLVSDGVLPSNEGRGYVLRKLIRRAARHGILLGIDELFLNDLLMQVIEDYKDEYPELKENEDMIRRVVRREEEKFRETIHQGLSILEEMTSQIIDSDKKVLSGENAFKLYDTYGFPLDLTKEILEEKGLFVDEEGFKVALDEQKTRSRSARREGEAGWTGENHEYLAKLEKTHFSGYDVLSEEGVLTAIYSKGDSLEELSEGEEGILVTNTSPFYGEGGGQVGDTGLIIGPDGKARVIDTKKTKNAGILHIVQVEQGEFSVADPLKLLVDINRRRDIMKNHSCTHLLHRALREILGVHVHQAGSLVTPDHLRFDFTHFEGISKEDLAKVEAKVNEFIFAAVPIVTEEMDYEASKEKGAMGLFEDKYQDKVRVVSMGDFSVELCGGTHVKNTGEIQMMRIVSEGSVASGVRRIEAITGRKVYEFILEQARKMEEIALLLGAKDGNIKQRIESLKSELKEKEEIISQYKKSRSKDIFADLLKMKKEVKGVNVVAAALEDVDVETLRNIQDHMAHELESVICVFGSKVNNKLVFTASVTKDLVTKGAHAGKIIAQISKIADGNGGGRADNATGGGKDVSKLHEAIDAVEGILEKMV